VLGTLVADVYGVARVGIGAGLVARPQWAAGWVGPAARDPDVHGTLRSFGSRELLLGTAVLATRGHPAAQRGALLLCAAADAVDVVVEGTDFARTRRRGAAIATLTALGGVALGVLSACLLPPPPSR
jgi:hypothetical protein